MPLRTLARWLRRDAAIASAAEGDGATLDVARLHRLRAVARTAPRSRIPPAGRQGGTSGRRRGAGLDIREIRPYAEGDDVRHLDAMASARTGTTHVRVFEEDMERTAFLIADFRPSMLWGTRRRLRSVAAAECLALLGWNWIDHLGDRLGAMVITGGEPGIIRPRFREPGMAAAIGLLVAAHEAIPEAPAGPPPIQPLDTQLAAFARVVPSGATVFLATALDDPGEELAAVIAPLARRCKLTILRPVDAFERAPPRGVYPFATPELRGVALLDRDVPPVTDALEARLMALGVTLTRFAADADDAALAAMLGGAGA